METTCAPELAAKTLNQPLQSARDGVGPLYHRQYWVDFDEKPGSESALMKTLIGNLNTCSPAVLAEFQKTKGDAANLRVGDEFLVKIKGPWDGPVRVVMCSPNSFTLQTLKGHLEAGRIQFSILEREDGWFRLMIESFARSQNRFIDFFYTHVPLIRWIQRLMWTSFCRRFVRDVLPAARGPKSARVCAAVCERTVQR